VRERNDSLFLLSHVDDFKKEPNYSKSSAKIEMIKLIQSYQLQPGFSAYHSQNEIYPVSRTAFDNAATPSSSHHQQHGYYSTLYPERTPTSDNSFEHSAVSPETLSQDSDTVELFN
jgi:hypothetical protein